MLVITCLKCRRVSWATHEVHTCSVCGGTVVNELPAERDKRLGIKKSDIRSWDISDQLKGLEYETAKEINEKTKGTVDGYRYAAKELDACG